MRQLALRVRGLIAEVLPGVFEVPWPKQRIAGFGVGPRKMTEHFCWVGVHKAHVNLGFNYGTELADPEGLLEGTGKLLRHVRISSLEDLERPAVRKLLEQAIVHRMPSR